MGRKNTKSARLKDKLRKQKQRQEVTESFTYLPVEDQWRNDQIDRLGLPVPHLPTTSTPSTSHSALPLTDPTKCYTITGDGNCFFSALSFIVAGNQSHCHLFRQKICEFMKANPDFVESYLPTECKGNIREYLKHSQMERDKEWATEVEIFTASMLLKTNIFVYSKSGKKWKWIQYSTVTTTYNNGIYIYHMNEDHFDLVVAVKNSNLMDGISEDMCYSMDSLNKKKGTHDKRKYSSEQYHHKKTANPNFQTHRNYLERQMYISDTDFATKRRTAVRQRYITKEIYKEIKKHAAKLRYCSNSLYRAALQNISKLKYQSSDNYRSAKKNSSKKIYHENEDFRKKVKDSLFAQYHGNENLRKKKKASSVRKYRENEDFRKKVKDSFVKKYHENEGLRKKKKASAVKKYRENEDFRKKVKDSFVKKYHENEGLRNKKKASSVKKYRENEDFRKKVKDMSAKKYRTFDTFKNNLRISSIKKYHSNPLFRAKLKTKLKMVYKHSVEIRRKKNARMKKSRQSISRAIAKFQKSIHDLPSYICTVCIRTLYRSQVKPCKRNNYMSDGALHEMAAICLTGKYIHQCDKTPCSCKGTRSKEWICHTCHRHLSNGHMPPQAQANNLTLLPIPEVLQRLNGLERQLIALRMPFMKLLSLPRGGQRGVKGPVVNVPTDLNKVTTTLPRTTNEAQFVKVKLKRKLEYKGHYQYEWVNPNNVIEAMRYLIDNNFWYSHIVFNESWLNDTDDPDLIRSEAPDTDSENEDEEKEHTKTSSDFPVESCLQPWARIS